VPYPLVSILIPTRNGADLVRVCLDSLLGKTTYPNYEILLIDNGSDDPLALECFARYAQEAHVRLLRDDSPFNFSAINNRAAREARGEYLLLLNNDTEVITPDWLERMLGYASQPENGAIGARLWYPDDTLQHAGVACPGGGPNHPFAGLPRGECGPLQRACITQRYLAVTAACLLVRASDYWRVGGLEESYAVGFNDVDFCFRLHASGLRNICVAEVELYHHESPSRGHDASPARKARAAGEMARLASRWGELLHNDPYV
jgi:GT2 family glycosyltransferase